MFDKEALGVAVRVLSTKQDSTKNIDIPTLTNITDLMGFKIENGEAVFDNQSDIDALRNADNINFVLKDGTFINAIDNDGNDIQIPIRNNNIKLRDDIIKASGNKFSEETASALATILSTIKMPEGKSIGIKNISELDDKTKALLKDKRGALLVDKLAIVFSPNSDETTVEHEGFHIVDILDDEHRGQLVKAISEVAHDEKAYAELIDILYEHKNQLGGKTVEEFIELLKKMDSTNENDNDMREARASLYEIWRETMDEEDYKKLPKNLSEAFKQIAEVFKRIYNNLRGHKLDSRISDAFSEMYRNQNTSNISLKEKNSILFQAKKNGEYEEIRNKYINTNQWMKAPNEKPTNLTEEQWIEVRTPSFKRWSGDWETPVYNFKETFINAIQELEKSKTIKGHLPYIPSLIPKENKSYISETTKTARRLYTNAISGDLVSFNRDSIRELFRHDYKNKEHLASIFSVPDFIQKGIPIASFTDNQHRNFKYFVSKFTFGDKDYLVRSVIREEPTGKKYYDHKLSSYKKIKDLISTGNSITSTVSGTSPSIIEDSRLLSLWQGFSKVLDENGEPMPVYHCTEKQFIIFDKNKNLQQPQRTQTRQQNLRCILSDVQNSEHKQQVCSR